MDHSMHGMDMPHSGHGDMDMGPKCKMNMLFTWSTEDLCIVFPKWHIGGPVSLFFSLLAIVLLTAGYEAVRQASQSYEARQLGTGRDGTIGASEGVGTDYISSYRDDRVHENDPEAAHPGSPGTYRDEENETETPDITHDEEANGSQIQAATSRAVNSNERQRRNVKITLAAFYAVQVFYSFFIM
ncbi:Ctr copper transporter [Ascosphaera apis ARSEF 7405]|uniref:Copper transport protein n=1 Tax=Ascosphaera apis ARSEF 7405 TaxID=392613 RepID=A0A166NBJ2_9EURO|nr:Ctr copper transporter [Ascosphaera apis ARSEF 7405]